MFIEMKTVIYLFIWCAIIVCENQSQPTENRSSKTDTSSVNLSNEVKHGSNKFNFSDYFILGNRAFETTITTTTEISTIHLTATKGSNENKQDSAITEPTKSNENINISTKMLSTSAEPIVSSETTTMFTPHSPHSEKERPSDLDSIQVSKFAIGFIIFTMTLMFFIIMALLFMLYKMKQHTSHRDSMDVAIEPNNKMDYKYCRQHSGETSNGSTLLSDKTKDSKLILTRSDSKALFFNNINTIDAIKDKSQIGDKKTGRITTPESNPTTAKGGRPSLSRVLKQPPINQVIISREQMSKVCEGVLSKTKRSHEAISLSDLDKILHESRKEEKEKTDLEKCLSTPELDSEMYDVLPTSSPKKFFNSESFKNEEFDDELYDNPPKHNIKKFNDPINTSKDEESHVEVYDHPVCNQHENEVFDDGIYDDPPVNHNRKKNFIVSTEHEDYVMPLTEDSGFYCNAKAYDDSKISKRSL